MGFMYRHHSECRVVFQWPRGGSSKSQAQSSKKIPNTQFQDGHANARMVGALILELPLSFEF
jgi:hypothetical protein